LFRGPTAGMDEKQLIGREPEQTQLDAWAAEARASRGSLVLLAGEAGVGKTALARLVLGGSGLGVLEGVAGEQGPAHTARSSRRSGPTCGPRGAGCLSGARSRSIWRCCFRSLVSRQPRATG